MNWESRYTPPDSLIWQGRLEMPADSCFYQHMRLLDLLSDMPKKTAPLTFALIGFKCDEGIQRDLGRGGAFEGPTAIRQQLAKLPIQKPTIHCYDAGNIVCTDHDLEASQMALAEVVSKLLAQGLCPIIMGGGHEMALGHYQGIALTYPPQTHLGILNFDTHFDMHDMESSRHGSASTVFYQIAEAHQATHRRFDYNCIGIQHAADIRQSFEMAKKFNVHYILADDLHQGLQEKCIDFVDRIIDENQFIYLSLSLNVFSPAFAPAVNSLQPLGLSPWQVIPFLRQAATSGKVVGYDIAELLPLHDINHRTAKLAATFIYEIIHHHHEPFIDN